MVESGQNYVISGQAYTGLRPESTAGVLPADWALAREHGMVLRVASEPGPAVEARELLRRLYGEPQQCGEQSPYLAGHARFQVTLPGEREKTEGGGVEYRYWPDLRLGYIENVQVTPGLRRRGVGVRLIRFALEHLRRLGADSVHAFTVSPQGFSLLTGAGFAPEPAGDAGSPWRCWLTAK